MLTLCKQRCRTPLKLLFSLLPPNSNISPFNHFRFETVFDTKTHDIASDEDGGGATPSVSCPAPAPLPKKAISLYEVEGFKRMATRFLGLGTKADVQCAGKKTSMAAMPYESMPGKYVSTALPADLLPLGQLAERKKK